MTLPSERTSREIRSGRINRRPPSFVVTLVALAIIFALAWTFFLRSGPAAPTPRVEGIKGTYTWDPGTGRASEDGTFSAVASGNAGGEAAIPSGTTANGRRPAASAYDAATRTETTVGDGLIGWYGISIGEWPPVWRVATRSPLDYQGLSAIVRTAVEDRDDAVGIKPLKDGDRAVWRAAMTLGGQPVELVVDQQTGIVTWYTDGRAIFTASVDWASPPPADKTYPIDTAGAAVENDARRRHLCRVAGGGGPHGRLRPARLGAGAGWLLTQGRRRLRPREPGDGLGARRSRRPPGGRAR